MTAPAKRPHHHGSLKADLVSYALSLARMGTIDDMSLRRAARDLNVSPAAVYRHFADKKALFEALALQGFDMLAEAFDTAAPLAFPPRTEEEARDRFMAIGAAYVGFATAHYGLWRLMFGPYGRGALPPDGRPNTYLWLSRALEDLHRTGVIRKPGPPEEQFTWSAIHGLSDLTAAMAAQGQDGAVAPSATAARPDDSQIRHHCALILRALAR
ncbi:TetR/AcrR family transcriptional regulator [Pseudooceanicola sp. C21-150M6]|uniref:TetR/AcrR family transcriptional regulator n=1 Tax=Pseudooceanicola sp. C21-150M6 TaxID=3434355 RepID=UPI003D7FF465